MATTITLADRSPYEVETTLEKNADLVLAVTQRAARLGNNVGMDEFTADTIAALISVSDVYTVRKAGDPDVTGLLILQPSPSSRSILPLVEYFHIILAEGSIRESRELYGRLVDLCVKLAIDKGKGYLGAMTSVFTPHVSWYHVLRNRKFSVTATVPSEGNLLASKNTNTYLMYRAFEAHELNGKVYITS